MATIRWEPTRTDTAHDDEMVVVFATVLEAPSWRLFGSVMSRVRGIARQLRTSDGSLGFELRADLRRRHMTTVSIWRDHAAATAFVTTPPHHTVMTELAGRMGQPTFVSVEQPRGTAVLRADAYLDTASTSRPI